MFEVCLHEDIFDGEWLVIAFYLQHQQQPTTPPRAVTVQDRKEFLYTCDSVFLDELPQDDDDGFDIEQKTDEISSLLHEHSETLEATFSRLTDQVGYQEFWKRYFYRLEPAGDDDEQDQRLKATYEYYYSAHQQQLAEEEEDETPQKGPNPLASVTQFLGGAVMRLVEDGGGEEDTEGVFTIRPNKPPRMP
jgi:hypothetical protein